MTSAGGQMLARPSISGGPVIVFDAECVLCSASAQFILKHDRRRYFRLASMQGEVGAGLYQTFGIDPSSPESMIVVNGGELARDSDAVLAIAGGLGWPWRVATALRLVPKSIRDPVYRWLARNRYRIFGRRDACWVSLPDDADRVL